MLCRNNWPSNKQQFTYYLFNHLSIRLETTRTTNNYLGRRNFPKMKACLLLWVAAFIAIADGEEILKAIG